MNTTYYNVGVQLATTVNGTVFNRFLQWSLPLGRPCCVLIQLAFCRAVKDNTTYSEYQLSYVIPQWEASVLRGTCPLCSSHSSGPSEHVLLHQEFHLLRLQLARLPGVVRCAAAAAAGVTRPAHCAAQTWAPP